MSEYDGLIEPSWAGLSGDGARLHDGHFELRPTSAPVKLRSPGKEVKTGNKAAESGARLMGPMPYVDGSVAFGTIRLYECCTAPGDEVKTYIRGPSRDEVYPSDIIANGVNKRWIRLDGLSVGTRQGITSLRVYILPEDVSRSVRGAATNLKAFRKLIKYLVEFVDCTTEAWTGAVDPDGPVRTYKKPELVGEESLFYIFNTLTSPQVNFDKYHGDIHGRKAMEDVLNGDILGLKTTLYPYQQRSIAAMIQKEAGPAKIRDPRKSEFLDIYNNPFYLDVDEGTLLQDLPLYFETRGGILAETMGYGKTLICLALILATRGHYPAVPLDCMETSKEEINEKVPTLLSLAAKQLKHKGLPWKTEFFHLRKSGYHYDSCIAELKKHERSYNESMVGSVNPTRKGKPDYVNTIRLCSATLVVVPPNLIIQWQQEVKKHIDDDALDVLVIDTRDKVVPSWQELVKYDIVLISKSRFEQEYRDDELNTGNRYKGQAKYKSPLTEVRWLRVICDEGHGFAGSASKTNAMAMLDKMFIERRWVVSGTPSSSLHGVEVGLASVESGSQPGQSRRESFGAVLKKRQAPSPQEADGRDLERLRLIVVNFLKLQPWANNKEDKADWKTYLAPRINESTGTRHSMPALREVMQSLIVRHRIQDVDCDLALPPLHNKVVYIEPSYHDKVSINLFVLLLISNYITSEREDEDYMFHPRNRTKLTTLLTNLSNATFYCISFTQEAVQSTIDISNKYLNERIDSLTDSDGILLTKATLNGERAISDPSWLAFSTMHEMGAYIGEFPEHAKAAWSLDTIESEPVLLGTTQTREVQRYVNTRMLTHPFQDPCFRLSGMGVKTMSTARNRAVEEQKQRNKANSGSSQKAAAAAEGPQKRPPSTISPAKQVSRPSITTPLVSGSLSTEAQSHTPSQSSKFALPNSQILGFVSSKLTYLANRILYAHPNEKSIIFYTHNNTAFFIAEALELLGISHRIYSNTLSVPMRGQYVAQFNSDDSIRVLLMDLRQAGQGLHVAAASRVYIVSPIWDRGLESQAIKRAHRIGQTRDVFVETLVLGGTIEEAMVQRRRQKERRESRSMGTNVQPVGSWAVSLEDVGSSKSRHSVNTGSNATGKSMLDDSGMVKVLKEIDFLPIRDDEERFSRLQQPVPLFKDVKTGDHVMNMDASHEFATPMSGNTSDRSIEVDARQNTKLQFKETKNMAHGGSEPSLSQSQCTDMDVQEPAALLHGGDETISSIFGPQKFDLKPSVPSAEESIKLPEKRKAKDLFEEIDHTATTTTTQTAPYEDTDASTPMNETVVRNMKRVRIAAVDD